MNGQIDPRNASSGPPTFSLEWMRLASRAPRAKIRLIAMLPDLDTTSDAAAVQLAIYRNMSGSERVRAAHQMSLDARAIAHAAIRNRHPEYDDATAQWALFRLLLGDQLFQKAWPSAPLVTP